MTMDETIEALEFVGESLAQAIFVEFSAVADDRDKGALDGDQAHGTGNGRSGGMGMHGTFSSGY